MVAARKLEPEKQLIEVVLLHKFEGKYPDVPISPDIDFDGLVQPDREAGEDPFFITLLLGYRGQVSRNQRRYVGDIAPKAILNAINNRRITGQLGHTAEDRQAWEFKIPCLHWVGALIDSQGQVWGKAYIPRTEMQLREYYRIQARTNATVGTSLSGMGYQEWNDELEMWDITDLEVHRIDAVSPEGVGILKAGGMPPKITSESHNPLQEAAPDEVAVGDFVTWERDGALVWGQVNTIFMDGEVQIPYNDDAPVLIATEENPIARMNVFEPNWDDGGWQRTSWQVVQYVKDLGKIDALPESHPEDNRLSEGQLDTPEQDELRIDQESEENPMEEKPKRKSKEESETTHDEETPLVELKQQYQAETRELKLKISEQEALLRNYNTIVEMLAIGGKPVDDPILALQAVFNKVTALEAENFDLLDTAITQEVAEHVKVEILRPVIASKVRERKPARKTEVKKAVVDVLAHSEIKMLMQYTVQQEMGPNVELPKTPVPDAPVSEQWIIIPGMEGAK
jgi:hypothetical protein